jgi:nucleoside-diphosphate-sugar epimerase/SAM-dependent methyltransferase
MKILVTGGAGHIGSVLVPMLLEKGYDVVVLDNFWFWNNEDDYKQCMISRVPDFVESRLLFETVKGDIRNKADVLKAVTGCESVIHLACLSNDPSADVDKDFTFDVNFNGSKNVIDVSKESGVKFFVYASSSSVYGVQNVIVTEEVKPAPLTQYSELKVKVEDYLLSLLSDSFRGVIIRPSTVCGVSPRMRLDLVVNILAYSATKKGVITVNGGSQLRPLIHIKDMARLYALLLEIPSDQLNGKVYNAGYDNYTLLQIADMIKEELGSNIPIEVKETNDLRSYHVNSDKIKLETGYEPEHSIKEAIKELITYYENSTEDFEEDKYYNLRITKKHINSRLLNIVTPLHKRTQRDYLARMIDNKVEAMTVAKKYEKDYWDGDRRYGYGGYRYIRGYWKPVGEAMIKKYGLTNESKVLDVGCGKAHLLYELTLLLPGLEVHGIDISEHGINNAPESIRNRLSIQKAQEPPYHNIDNLEPFPDKYFDLVISITTLHNLILPELKKAVTEIERIGKNKFICVESYKNELELFNLQCWALTCQSFLKPEEWKFLYDEWGYNGDYEYIYFE